MRYNLTIYESNLGVIEKYDFFIDTIIDFNLPEVDLDQWVPLLGKNISEYTRIKVMSFAIKNEQS